MNPQEIKQVGPYPVRRFINEGGMALVFEVIDPRYGVHEVVRALKLLKPESAAGKEFERFHAEAALLAGFAHQNLVTIFDFGRDESTGCFYYTMTYVDGPTLAQLLARDGALEPERAVEIFSDVLAGLAELHQKKIVHRDIKPGNVFTHADGHVRLGDLGIAHIEDTTGQTKTGYAVGTVLYMSPEQARGVEVRTSSDIFAVGLTLYEALLAQNVYASVEGVDSTSDWDVLGYLASRGRAGEELEVDFGNAAIPDGIARVIRKALRYDAMDRYQEAGEMREALLAAAPGVRRVPVPAPQIRRGWLVAAAILAATGVGIWQLAEWWRVRSVEVAALERIEEAEVLNAVMPELRVRVQDLDEPLPLALREKLDHAADRAEEYLLDAQRFAKIEQWKAAEAMAQEAMETLGAGCESLNVEVLAGGVDQKAHRLKQRVETLRKQGAAEHLPREWTVLEAKVAAIPAAPTAAECEATGLHFNRHESLTAVLTSAGFLENGLAKYLPRAIEGAIAEVQRNKERAEVGFVDAEVYQVRIKHAQVASKEADAARARGDINAALVAYGRSAKSYVDAAEIRPAWMARSEVRRLEAQVETLGKSFPASVSRVVRRGDVDYAQGAWEDATTAYWEAVDGLREIIGQGEPARVATRKRDEAIVNSPPTLRVTPQAKSIRLVGGGGHDFIASVGDPDADPVDVVFKLDGQQVATGTSYRYRANEPGEHRLEVVASDAAGAETTFTWRIEVSRRPSDSVAQARAALDRYVAAYAARDLESLTKVWRMSPMQRRGTAALFEAADSISISITERDVSVSQEHVSIDFDQRVVVTGVKIPDDIYALRATIEQRGDGEWVISSVLPIR